MITVTWRGRRPVGAALPPSRMLAPAVGGLAKLSADPSHGVYPANSPRAGRQQGYAGSGGCAGGPFPSGEDEVMAGDGPSPASEGPAHRADPAAPIALYRRDRPATLTEVRGQEHGTGPPPQ